MNKDTGEITEMTLDEHKKLEKMFAKGLNEHMIPIPDGKRIALDHMSVAKRIEWARGQRPSLASVVEAGVELTPTQRKAHDKQERKRKRRTALAAKE